MIDNMFYMSLTIFTASAVIVALYFAWLIIEKKVNISEDKIEINRAISIVIYVNIVGLFLLCLFTLAKQADIIINFMQAKL